MRIEKGKINTSPFVGVFASVSEEFAIVPYSIRESELETLKKTLDVEIIKAKIADSSLIGTMAVGIKNKFVVSELALKSEIKMLEEKGLEVLALEGSTAIGNLLALNEFGGIASKILKKSQVKRLERFFEIEIVREKIANVDIVGSAIMVCNKGFIVHPEVSESEFKLLEKIFNVEGVATTLNYGDSFAGNNAIANSKGIIVGEKSTTQEIIRISDIFS